jgi:O-antigen biosynthesis protein
MKVRKLLDAEFYLRTNPDVRAAGMRPLDHYLQYGGAEGRQPHPLFDPGHYLACCPEARNAGNPLLHFLEQSGSWANPHPLFDCDAYLRAYPDAGNPLVHYSVAGPRFAEEGSQFGQC